MSRLLPELLCEPPGLSVISVALAVRPSVDNDTEPEYVESPMYVGGIVILLSGKTVEGKNRGSLTDTFIMEYVLTTSLHILSRRTVPCR